MKLTDYEPGWHCWWEAFSGWSIKETHNQDAIAWALLVHETDKERVLIIERTYRGTPKIIRHATDDDIEMCRHSAWDVWNRGT